MPRDLQTSPNRLKREARYLPDRDWKVRISFTQKYEPAGGAGEEEEYAQIWERSISVARMCLGKGKAKDKLVLNAAVCAQRRGGEA